jgi:hypothetical protein
MGAHDIEEPTGAVPPMSGHLVNAGAGGSVSVTRLRNKLRDALEAIGFELQPGDMIGAAAASHLVLEIHQALSIFGDLWRSDAIVQGEHDNLSVGAVGELTSAWLMNQLVEHVRKLDTELANDDKPPIWGDILAGAMAATRWAARWSWLRYKQPPARAWANAAYLYAVSERWRFEGDSPRTSGNALECSRSVRQEFARLLFAQWVSPISLSVPAQLLFEQLISESKVEPTISSIAASQEDALFDAESGLVLLRRQNVEDASIRYISFGPLREEICQRVTQLALLDAAKAEAAKQLLRSGVGRRTRTLVRLGGRVEMLRRVKVCVGYYTITANLREKDARFVDGFVLDRSEEGCRIRFERLSAETNRLCVGALLQVKHVFEGEIGLGIVRWLKRVEPAGWEVGVWLIRGSIHVRRMRIHDGTWPTGRDKEDVFLIDGRDRGSGAPMLGVLPKLSATPGMQLSGDDDQLCCDVLACVETGADFDVAVVADSYGTE